MKFAKFFLVLFVCFSWITHPVGGDYTAANVSNPIQRMTFGDIMGFLGLGIFLVVSLHRRISVPEIFRYALLFILLLTPGILTSHKSFGTFFEIFILSYLLLLGVVLYYYLLCFLLYLCISLSAGGDSLRLRFLLPSYSCLLHLR